MSQDNKKPKIFACGSNQVNSATTLLTSESGGITTLVTSFLSNLSSSSVNFMTQFAANNTSEKINNYKRAYYQDKCFNILIFICIFVMIKKSYREIYNTLKKSVDDSDCSIEEFIALKTQKPSDINIDF